MHILLISSSDYTQQQLTKDSVGAACTFEKIEMISYLGLFLELVNLYIEEVPCVVGHLKLKIIQQIKLPAINLLVKLSSLTRVLSVQLVKEVHEVPKCDLVSALLTCYFHHCYTSVKQLTQTYFEARLGPLTRPVTKTLLSGHYC